MPENSTSTFPSRLTRASLVTPWSSKETNRLRPSSVTGSRPDRRMGGGGSVTDRLDIQNLDTKTLNAPVAPIAPAGQTPSTAQPGAITAPAPQLNLPAAAAPAPAQPTAPAPAQ